MRIIDHHTAKNRFEVLMNNGEHWDFYNSWEDAYQAYRRINDKTEHPEPDSPHQKPKVSQKSTASAISSKKPWRSTAMAIPANQRAEFMEGAPQGVSYAEPDANGFCDLETTSRKARNAEMERRHVFDRDAGYGDRTKS